MANRCLMKTKYLNLVPGKLGDGGCYSYEAGKYHWKIKDQYVFLLAFNTYHDEAAQNNWLLKSAVGNHEKFSSKIK